MWTKEFFEIVFKFFFKYGIFWIIKALWNAIFRIEIGGNFMAVMLTILGYSINDTIGDIMSTLKGKIAMVKLLMLFKNVMSQGSKDGKPEVMGFSFGKINKSMIQSLYGMVKGFTIKRAFMMLGNKFTKEQILEVNAMLNKVKKK